MLNILKKQVSTVLSPFPPALVKLSHSDSAVIQSEPKKFKALAEENFSRIWKEKFQKNFVENFFINKFPKKVLEYPEVDTLEEADVLKKHFTFAQNLIAGKTDNDLTLTEVSSQKAVSLVKEHELCGFKQPLVKKGFGYLSSEYTFIQEALSSNPSLSKTISELEDFGIFLIDSFGTDSQKSQYLSKLINGENIACLAHIEPKTVLSFEEGPLDTTATLSSDSKSYLISGKKNWVYNANSANVFIVSANIVSSDGKRDSKPTFFLINRDTPGVNIHDPIPTIGLKELSVCDVTFDNVVVSSSSVFGELRQGSKIINTALSKGKLNNGAHCIALIRKIVDKTIKHCIHTKFFDEKKYEVDYFRRKIGRIVSQLYAVESVTYFLTGRTDNSDDSDVFLESVLAKIFASDSLQFIINESINILGPDAFVNDIEFLEITKDAQFYAACDDSNDYLKILLGKTGIKYAMNFHEKKGLYDRYLEIFNLQNVIKLFFGSNNVILSKNHLRGYLHLIFSKESKLLEDNLYRLSKCTKFLIKKHGQKLYERPFELKYLAELALNAYVTTATLSRASRAYCIGVKCQEIDHLCAYTIATTCSLRNREIENVLYQNPDNFRLSQVAGDVKNFSQYSKIFAVFRNMTKQSLKT